ncbi:MAG: CPBP family intramembrane metalloprotease [marine benthic group bacterium]|nr:CPBP family intramembrane metalloprotease [Candidatus Benthicola marisminoris]
MSEQRPGKETEPVTGVRSFLAALRADAGTLWKTPADRRAAQVLIASVILLIVFAIWGRPNFLLRHLPAVAAGLGMDPSHEYYLTLPYVYWGVSSAVVRILVPLLVIVVWIRARPSEFGYRIRGVTSHAWIYLAMFLVMLPIVFAASFMPAFQAKYPMYDNAVLGPTHFALWQIAYGVQFLGVEGFFRGFMTFGLYPRFGYLSLFIMVIPYALVHVGKPPVEVFMAVPAGLALGYLALKSRSWVFGALLHWAVGITMDALAVWHAGGFRT